MTIAITESDDWVEVRVIDRGRGSTFWFLVPPASHRVSSAGTPPRSEPA